MCESKAEQQAAPDPYLAGGMFGGFVGAVAGLIVGAIMAGNLVHVAWKQAGIDHHAAYFHSATGEWLWNDQTGERRPKAIVDPAGSGLRRCR